MKITLPVIWPVVGTLRRQKTQKLHHVHQLVEVEIREVDAINAPVCISSDQVDVRHYDGSFWYPVNEFSHCQNPPEGFKRHDETLENLRGLSEENVDDESFDDPVVETAFRTGHFAIWDHRHFKEKDFSEIEENNPDEALKELLDTVNDTILIDGFLWRRAGEPAIQIALWDKIRGTDVITDLLPVDAIDRGMEREHDQRVLFDVRTPAEDIIAAAAELLNVSPEEIPEIQAFDVLMPELIGNTIVPATFGQLVERAASKWWKETDKSFKSTSLKSLELFAKLKRGITALSDEPAIEQAEELNTAVQQALNEIRLPEESREQLLLATAYLENALQNMDLKIDDAFGMKP